jgi:hypothetical protein
LLGAIDREPERESIRNMISRFFKSCINYVDIVSVQGLAIQTAGNDISPENSQELARIDENRTRAHNSLISQIGTVNRLCQSLEVEPIYSGSENRREKGDFAPELIYSYFHARI